MKKLLLVLMSLFLVTIVYGYDGSRESLQINKKGEYRLDFGQFYTPEDEFWRKTEVTSEHHALEYISYFPEAISNPGKKIIVDEEFIKTQNLKFLFKKEVLIRERFIFYDSKTNNIKYRSNHSDKEETSYLILPAIISILLMIVSNIFLFLNKRKLATIFSIATTIASAIAAAIIIYAVHTFFGGFNCLCELITYYIAVYIIVIINISTAIHAIFIAYKYYDEYHDEYYDKSTYIRTIITFYISIVVCNALLFI